MQASDKAKDTMLEFFTNSIREQYDSIYNMPEAKDTYVEIIELVNDVIDYLTVSIEAHKSNLFTRFTIPSYVLTMLMPLPYGILMSFVVNNIPACLSQLRALLESLIRCAYVDLKDGEQDNFISKIERMQKLNFSDAAREVLNEKYAAMAITLWKNLSNEWVHPKGLMKKTVDHLVKHGTLPGFGLVIPMPFSSDEKQHIRETRRSVKQFRTLLKLILAKWAKHHKIPLKKSPTKTYNFLPLL